MLPYKLRNSHDKDNVSRLSCFAIGNANNTLEEDLYIEKVSGAYIDPKHCKIFIIVDMSPIRYHR